MFIIGCDYHPAFQQIAFVDTETGELQERRLGHGEEAEKSQTVNSRYRKGRYVLGWRRAGMRAGLNDCSPN